MGISGAIPMSPHPFWLLASDFWILASDSRLLDSDSWILDSDRWLLPKELCFLRGFYDLHQDSTDHQQNPRGYV